MSTAELVKQLKHLNNAQRLEVIEAATRLIRQDLLRPGTTAKAERDLRMRAAAARLKDLYEPGGELTEWTSLDGEEVLDDYD